MEPLQYGPWDSSKGFKYLGGSGRSSLSLAAPEDHRLIKSGQL